MSRPHAFPSLLLLATLLLGGPVAAEEPALTRDQKIHHFLNRFSLGATPALVHEVKRKGIDFWLDTQLAGVVKEDPGLQERLAALQSLSLTSRQIMERYVKPVPPDATAKERQAANRLRNVPRNELRDGVVLNAVYSTRQVQEAVSDFFRNHFCVAVDKSRVRYYATEYEREVIRARVFSTFGDMLRASARHPAMLYYLDNVVSRRPPTKAELKKVEMNVRLKTKSKDAGKEASDIAAQRGLNENYARELLELHTLGVDNFYSQRDVENVAMTLTGWTVSNDKKLGHVFEFKAAMHVGGEKHFLSRLIARNKKDPIAEGEKVLDMLIQHKGTARFIAFKLCRWFVNDHPPDALVERIAEVFKKSGGDLKTIYKAIEADPEFYRPENYRAKLKRPFEFVVSALRATGAGIKQGAGIHRALRDMSEDLYLCKDPTGYYDQAEAWQDPGAFAVRWKFAYDLAANKLPGVTVPDSLYAGLVPGNVKQWKELLAARLLPVGLDRGTSRAIDRVVAKHLSRPHKEEENVLDGLAPKIVALVLGSPEFQQQ